MKNIHIKASELFLLRKFFNNAPLDSINAYYKKKTYTSSKDKYREGSEKWLLEVAKDEEHTLLPDFKVSDEYADVIIDNQVKFGICTIEHKIEHWNYDLGEPYTETVKSRFLCENSHWGHGIITDMEELWANHNVQKAIEADQENTFYREIYDRLRNLGDCFTLLRERVYKAHEQFIDVSYYTKYVTADHRRIDKCVVIGDKEVFTEEELQKVSTALENDVRFYNDQDEIVEFKSYDNDYLTYYRKYSNL
jgi:hypothetical protein